MTRVLALLAVLCFSPLSARAEAPVTRPATKQKLAAPKKFDVSPPQGFRPSDVVDRLVDVLATNVQGRYAYHPQMAPLMRKDGTVISIDFSLLHSKNANERSGVQHVLAFAKSYGFSIHSDGDVGALKHALTPYGAEKLVSAE